MTGHSVSHHITCRLCRSRYINLTGHKNMAETLKHSLFGAETLSSEDKAGQGRTGQDKIGHDRQDRTGHTCVHVELTKIP